MAALHVDSLASLAELAAFLNRDLADEARLEAAYLFSLPECPNCGERAEFTEHRAHHVETHGLDCGPYEHWDQEWITCNCCGAATDWKELASSQSRHVGETGV